MFSVGDYELDQSNFAKFDPKKAGMVGSQRPPNTTPGVRKAYVRTVKGKAVSVGQSILKAGKRTSGALASGGSKAWKSTTEMAGKGWKGTTDIAGKGVGMGKKYGGQAANLVKSNPKASAIVAGATALGAGAGVLATRPKRERR